MLGYKYLNLIVELCAHNADSRTYVTKLTKGLPDITQ